MKIKIGQISEDQKTVNKTFVEVAEIDVVLKEDSSILNPRFIIQKGTTADYLATNYVYVEAYGRYYYCEPVPITGGRVILECAVDALMSFKDQFTNLPAIIEKQQNPSEANKYLNDGSFVSECRSFNEIKNFPDGLPDSGNLVLICAG